MHLTSSLFQSPSLGPPHLVSLHRLLLAGAVAQAGPVSRDPNRQGALAWCALAASVSLFCPTAWSLPCEDQVRGRQDSSGAMVVVAGEATTEEKMV